MRSVRIVGNGRAGGALAGALASIGWSVDGPRGRGDPVTGDGVDLLVLAVPDAAVAAVEVPPTDAVVAHLSGSLGPVHGWSVLHPLVSLPDPVIGAERLRAGAWFGVAAEGDPLVLEVVAALGGTAVTVTDWARYHAAAVVASNHLVGLLGQVERIAASIGVPLDAYLDLARGSLDNVVALGPAAALTGPVRRGDWVTVERHLAALPDEERAAYEAGVDLCRRLVDP